MATCKDFDSGSDHITQTCIYCSNVSDGYCHDCETFMCQTCFDKHTKARPCRHHVLVDSTHKPDITNQCSKTCVRHPNQHIQYHCVDHELVGCVQCFFPDHRNCRFEEIHEAAKRFQQRGDDSRLKDKLHELESKHSVYRNKCDEDKEAVSVINTQVVNDVKSFKKDVIAFAKKVESHALEEAERLRIDNETRVEKRMSELDNVGENIEQCLVKLEKQPTADEFFIAAVEVKPEVEILEQKLTSIEGLGAVRRYTFTPRSDVIEMIQDVRSCGEIRTISENSKREDEEEEGNDDVNSEHDGVEQACKLLISDIPSTVDDDYITWFFERKNNFGGLEVEDVVYNEEEGIAIVEFGSPDDIEAVLEKVPIKMKGKEVSVDRYEPEPEELIDPCCVQVTGPQDIVADLETIEYYFESKRSCGGDIANIRYDEDLNLTVIWFENEVDAQKVIEKYEHEVDGETLFTEQYTPRNSKLSLGEASPRQQDVSDDEDFQGVPEEIWDTVRVSGVIPSIRSTAELYFENTRRSGGGEVESMWEDEDSENTVYIKFVNAEDAQNVLEREHIVKGKSLTVELYSPVKKPRPEKQRKQEPVPVVHEEVEEVIVMDTVKVTGVDPAKRNAIELYFENRRRSGGGEYDKLWSDEEEAGVIYMKFKTEEVARNVASRSHIVEKCELKVTLYTPPTPPPCYEDKILIKGLKETTSQDGLFSFIEAKSGFIPKSLDYHESETGVVMVTFESRPDIDKLEAACKKYQLEGSTLKISPVAVSSCIMVSELPETVTKDTLQFYFENHRKSGGGEVDKVVMNDDDTWLVYFKDYTVIDNVLKKKHVLSNQTIVVQRYQECLCRPEGDVKERKLKIPEPVILTEVDKDKVKYLKNSPKKQQDIQKQLDMYHAKIIWPNRDEDIKIECTITQSVENCYKLVKSWKKDVLTCVNSYIADIVVVVKTSFLQGAWQNLLQKLPEISREDPESVAIFVDSKANLLVLEDQQIH